MQAAQIVRNDQRTAPYQLGGGTKIEPLSPAAEDAYCVMIGTIPPGASVPLHSHGDAESFYVLSGEAEALVQTRDGLQWQLLGPGEFIHIPGGAKHAWRNLSSEPMSSLVTCTARLGRALEEMGQVAGGFPAQAAVQHIVEISQRYGYWLGSPEENAAVGIQLV